MNRSIQYACAALLCLALAGTVSSCGDGGKSTDTPAGLVKEANQALGRKEWPAAASAFGAALEKIDATAQPELAMSARLGKIEALAPLDAKKSKAEMLELMETHDVSFADFSTVTTALVSGRHFDDAIALLTVAKEKGKDQEKLKALIETVGDRAKSAGDSGAVAALAGLGYVGNDN